MSEQVTHILRAMAVNYLRADVFDTLDSQALNKAADQIDALHAEAEALRAENAALRESSQDVRSLVEALEECAASLAWNCLGECRAIHAGPIMPAAMALDTARATLAAHRQAQPQ